MQIRQKKKFCLTENFQKEELRKRCLNFLSQWKATWPDHSSFSPLTWLAAIGELFLTHSSTILTTARRILASGDFSMREVRMAWMKFFLISMLITASRVFTSSRLSITSSLVPAQENTPQQLLHTHVNRQPLGTTWHVDSAHFPPNVFCSTQSSVTWSASLLSCYSTTLQGWPCRRLPTGKGMMELMGPV